MVGWQVCAVMSSFLLTGFQKQDRESWHPEGKCTVFLAVTHLGPGSGSVQKVQRQGSEVHPQHPHKRLVSELGGGGGARL